VDGCFWHRCPEHGSTPRSNTAYWGPKLDRTVARDATVNERLRGAGWTVMRIWEHVPPEAAAEQVAATVRG
jgi:DNA mismatch endonuclease (patch repair protein)